ncbi:Uncharacterised protein, partial [Mycoplasmopsis synoviae]
MLASELKFEFVTKVFRSSKLGSFSAVTKSLSLSKCSTSFKGLSRSEVHSVSLVKLSITFLTNESVCGEFNIKVTTFFKASFESPFSSGVVLERFSTCETIKLVKESLSLRFLYNPKITLFSESLSLLISLSVNSFVTRLERFPSRTFVTW